eukprot:841429-Prorocentrum_minimum.AAC.1
MIAPEAATTPGCAPAVDHFWTPFYTPSGPPLDPPWTPSTPPAGHISKGPHRTCPPGRRRSQWRGTGPP